MYIEINKTSWFIHRGNSIYTTRNNLEDVTIWKEHKGPRKYGARRENGKTYNTVLKLAAETGEVLRDYEPIPAEINAEFLKQSGFLD